jgi:hypothetical protein
LFHDCHSKSSELSGIISIQTLKLLLKLQRKKPPFKAQNHKKISRSAQGKGSPPAPPFLWRPLRAALRGSTEGPKMSPVTKGKHWDFFLEEEVSAVGESSFFRFMLRGEVGGGVVLMGKDERVMAATDDDGKGGETSDAGGSA